MLILNLLIKTLENSYILQNHSSTLIYHRLSIFEYIESWYSGEKHMALLITICKNIEIKNASITTYLNLPCNPFSHIKIYLNDTNSL